MIDRRRFLTTCSTLAAGVALVPQGVQAAIHQITGLFPGDIMLESLSHADFSSHVSSVFRFQAEASAAVSLKLIEVSDHVVRKDKIATRLIGREEFALLFVGPFEHPLSQGLYAVQHPVLGALELFVVPVGKTEDGLLYEHIFNRFMDNEGNTILPSFL